MSGLSAERAFVSEVRADSAFQPIRPIATDGQSKQRAGFLRFTSSARNFSRCGKIGRCAPYFGLNMTTMRTHLRTQMRTLQRREAPVTVAPKRMQTKLPGHSGERLESTSQKRQAMSMSSIVGKMKLASVASAPASKGAPFMTTVAIATTIAIP